MVQLVQAPYFFPPASRGRACPGFDPGMKERVEPFAGAQDKLRAAVEWLERFESLIQGEDV
jgi:hypothetical protein